jgi:hypothetical protein
MSDGDIAQIEAAISPEIELKCDEANVAMGKLNARWSVSSVHEQGVTTRHEAPCKKTNQLANQKTRKGGKTQGGWTETHASTKNTTKHVVSTNARVGLVLGQQRPVCG